MDLTADEITSDEVTISWRPPNYFEVEFYQVQMSSGSGSKWRNITRINGERNSTTLDNLEPDTNYLIRMESWNNHGVGKVSETLLVETEGIPLYCNDWFLLLTIIFLSWIYSVFLAVKSSVVVIVVVVLLVVVILLGSVLGFVYHRRRRGPTEIANNVSKTFLLYKYRDFRAIN